MIQHRRRALSHPDQSSVYRILQSRWRVLAAAAADDDDDDDDADARGPNSTASTCCGFVGQKVAQQNVRDLNKMFVDSQVLKFIWTCTDCRTTLLETFNSLLICRRACRTSCCTTTQQQSGVWATPIWIGVAAIIQFRFAIRARWRWAGNKYTRTPPGGDLMRRLQRRFRSIALSLCSYSCSHRQLYYTARNYHIIRNIISTTKHRHLRANIRYDTIR